MLCVNYNKNIKVGDWVVTKRKVGNYVTYFDRGTQVKVIGVSKVGYDLKDARGTVVLAAGFDSVCKK